MVDEIQRKAIKLVRIHTAGDFYSLDYFAAWCEIATRLPGVTFYAYTRTWRIPAFSRALQAAEKLGLPNLTLWQSTDPTTGTPADAPRTAYILTKAGNYSADMPKPNCRKQTEKSNCAECGLCFDRSRDAVTFIQH